MKPSCVSPVWACLFLGLTTAAVSPALGYELDYGMLAIEYDTGDVYEVSPTTAALTFLGSTGIAGFGALEFAPDGTLYGFTTGLDPDPKLYEIDIRNTSTGVVPVTPIGGLGIGFVFDGALAFAPDGKVYGTNRGATSDPDLFTIDINTGQATVVGTIIVEGEPQHVHDINGMVWGSWRGQRTLIGIDRVDNALLSIDPADASAEVLTSVDPALGAFGGMAVWGNNAFFATGGPDAFPGGSNELYGVDLLTGQHWRIGSFAATLPAGRGISGLAIVPEPASFLLLAAGGLLLSRRRR